jgi:acyl carrier protein
MELQELIDQLTRFFKENTTHRLVDICGSSRLKEDLDLEDLDYLELVMKLEDYYHIRISDADANRLQTVEDVANLILKLRDEYS